MRMGFFMGVMIGAAATYYYQRNKPMMAGISDKAMNTLMGGISPTTNNSASSEQPSSSQSSQQTELKNQLDEILQDSENQLTQ